MSLALLIASLVSSAIQTIPGLPSEIATAAGSIASVLGVLIKNGVGSGTVTASTQSIVLASLSALVTQLKATGGLSASALADITLLQDALTAALNVKITSVDPTQLQPIAPMA